MNSKKIKNFYHKNSFWNIDYEAENYTNFKNKDKKNKNFELNEIKLKELKKTLHTYNSLEEMKNIILFNLDPGEIYNKYLYFIEKDTILYEGDYYYKKNNIQDYFKYNFIHSENSPLSCYNTSDGKKFILINDLLNVKKYFHDDYLIIFIETEYGNVKKLKFNDFEVVLEKDMHKYPFLIFEPMISNTYILRKENTYYLLILINSSSGDEFKILTNKNTVNSYLLLLEIGNNFIFPNFKSEYQIDLLKEIYCEFGCRKEVMYNFNLENEEGLFRLKNYDVKNKKIDNFKYCYPKELDEINNINLFDEIETGILNLLEPEIINSKKKIIIEDVDTEDIDNFFKKYPPCNLNCDNINDIKEDLNNKLRNLEEELIDKRVNLSSGIFNNNQNIEKGGIFTIIYNNYSNIYKIMQINILLNNLPRIFQIINNCDNFLSCKEYYEIRSYLDIPDIPDRNNISFINLVFELLAGFIITKEQWEKFELIFNNYENENFRIVNQFMMGKGKSSVIMPLLILNLQNHGNIKIVVPNHLINQTTNNTKVLKNLFNLKFDILSDSDAKLILIFEKKK